MHRNISYHNFGFSSTCANSSFNCLLLQIRSTASTEVQNYPETPLNATAFQDYITEFLVTGDGIKHAEDSVVFKKQLSCYEKAPKIVMLMVPYIQKR